MQQQEVLVMALFMRHSLSEQGERLTAALYKVIAQIAETYVFVYLGVLYLLKTMVYIS